jgi:ABC-type amino acid transport substrate-binding protein
MRVTRFFMFLVLLLSFVASYADLEEIQAAGVMRVAIVSGSDTPFFVERDGRLTGFDIDLINKIASLLNVRVQYVRHNHFYDGLVGIVERGEADIALGDLSRTVDRAEHVYFTQPYFEQPVYLLVKQTDNTRYYHNNAHAMTQNPHLTLGVVSHSAYSEYAQFLFKHVKVLGFKTRLALAQAVDKGKIDAGLIAKNDIDTTVARHPQLAVSLTGIVIPHLQDNIAIAVNFDEPHLLAWLNVVLDTLKRTEFFAIEKDVYFGELPDVKAS